MQYIETIKKSFLFFPLIAFLITIPFIISNYHKYGSIHKLRVFIIYSFVLYLLTIYFLVILPLPSIEKVRNLTTPTMNLIPFSFVGDFIKESPLIITEPSTYLLALKHSSFYVVIFNIFMTIPFGMYLKYYYKCSFKKTLLISFLLSLFFELTQLSGLYFIYPRAYRLFDVDDLILNTTGGIIGFGIMSLLGRFLPSRDKIDIEAKEQGRIVSPLRKLTITFLDIFLYLILLTILVLIVGNRHTIIVSFIVYYLIIPLVLNGTTLASKFLNVKKVFNKHPLIFSIIHPIFKAFYYFLLPFLPLIFIFYFNNLFNNLFIKIIFTFSGVTIIPLFYLVNLIALFKEKSMFYDKYFNLEYKSTIKVTDENTNQ